MKIRNLQVNHLAELVGISGKIVIQPYPDERLGYASASYDSPYGKIVSAWKYEEGKVKYYVEIPANMCAEIRIDGREKRVLDAGNYEL